VVYVGMAENNCVKLCRIKRKRVAVTVFIFSAPLNEPAVEQYRFFTHFDQVARSGDLLRRSAGLYLHARLLRWRKSKG